MNLSKLEKRRSSGHTKTMKQPHGQSFAKPNTTGQPQMKHRQSSLNVSKTMVKHKLRKGKKGLHNYHTEGLVKKQKYVTFQLPIC